LDGKTNLTSRMHLHGFMARCIYQDQKNQLKQHNPIYLNFHVLFSLGSWNFGPEGKKDTFYHKREPIDEESRS
jgi:hypothetical protein